MPPSTFHIWPSKCKFYIHLVSKETGARRVEMTWLELKHERVVGLGHEPKSRVCMTPSLPPLQEAADRNSETAAPSAPKAW